MLADHLADTRRTIRARRRPAKHLPATGDAPGWSAACSRTAGPVTRLRGRTRRRCASCGSGGEASRPLVQRRPHDHLASSSRIATRSAKILRYDVRRQGRIARAVDSGRPRASGERPRRKLRLEPWLVAGRCEVSASRSRPGLCPNNIADGPHRAQGERARAARTTRRRALLEQHRRRAERGPHQVERPRASAAEQRTSSVDSEPEKVVGDPLRVAATS